MLRSVLGMYSEGVRRLTWKLSSLVLAAIFIGVAGLLLTPLGCQGGTVDGVIAHKVVSGVKDDTSFTILVNYSQDGRTSIRVKDKNYEGYFSQQEQNATVSESLENIIRQEYLEINYFVNLRVSSDGEGTQPYRVSREVFNEMRVGSKVTLRSSSDQH